jgi:hypothetical protein
MSPYGYDYSLAPSPSTGWRSRFATVMSVGAIAAISAISGAAVALNLLAPAGTAADRPVAVATYVRPASKPVAQTMTPAAPQPAITTATVAPSRVPAAAVRPASPPAAAPAPQPVPAVAAVEAPPTTHVAESELTFTRGYARRHAIQAAVETSSPKSEGPQTAVAGLETQGQFGRAAKAKPKAVARANAPQDPRRVAEEGGPFSRFDRPERFDFARHQALAFGDPRANRRPPPQQGGFFGGLY